MTTEELRIKYGKKCWFNCKDGDEAFTDGYVMWLEQKVMTQALSLGGVSNRRELYFAFMKEYNALMGESEHQILKEEVEVLLAKYSC